MAVVVPVPEQRASVEQEALRAWAKERIALYKVPRRFLLVDALPRNALGKVTKPELVASLIRARPLGA